MAIKDYDKLMDAAKNVSTAAKNAVATATPVAPPAANQYAGTNYHQDAINAAQNYAAGNGNWKSVIDALNSRDNKIMATGNNGGRTSASILQELTDKYYTPAQKPAAYGGSEYDKLLKEAVGRLGNMSYADFKTGDQYKALMDSYNRNGERAMQDTLAQVSARTGGLASSYAGTAAQQSYNNFMQKLEDAALAMYDKERANQFSMADLYRGLANDDYSRWGDDYNRWIGERDWQHGLQREGIEDKRYDTEYGDSRADVEWNRNKDMADTLAAYGDFSGYKALGYSDAQINAMKSAYQQQLALSASRGGGGRSSSSKSSTPTMSKTMAEQYAKNGIFSDSVREALYAAGYTDDLIKSKFGWNGNQENDDGVDVRTGKGSQYGKAFASSISNLIASGASAEKIEKSINDNWYRLNEDDKKYLRAALSASGIEWTE